MSKEETKQFLKDACGRRVVRSSNNSTTKVLSLLLSCGHSIAIRTDIAIPSHFKDYENKIYPCNVCQEEGAMHLEP